MSTDTDDEGGGGGDHAPCHAPSSSDDGLQLRMEPENAVGPSTTRGPGSAAASTLLITANVGSIFEDPDQLIPRWRQEVFRAVQQMRPNFVAMHFQEVGGKKIQESVLKVVKSFVHSLVDQGRQLGYARHCVFFDQNYKLPEKFTALGSLYLVHNSMQRVDLYDFEARSFFPLTPDQSQVHLGTLEHLPHVEKHKFPLDFFPDRRWSRKGYLRTRWRLNGTALDLVNVHLIHDASNLISMSQEEEEEEDGPSIYSRYRRRALQHTLDRILEGEQEGEVPHFVFGDFNFRLEGRAVLRKLTDGLARRKSTIIAAALQNDNETEPAEAEEEDYYVDEEEETEAAADDATEEPQPVLKVGKKSFALRGDDHEATFGRAWEQWTAYDKERAAVAARLEERPLNFPPTYPFAEDPARGGSSYMRTRCPAWCDRVLYSPGAAAVMAEEDGEAGYDVLGADVCMGDHKPVFLRFVLRPDVDGTTAENKENERERVEHPPPKIESPTYSDLMKGGTAPRTSYIEIKDVVTAGAAAGAPKGVKVFKETTV